MADFVTHFYELVTVDKSICDVQDMCGCILSNSPGIKAGSNNRRYIKHPCDHTSKYHFTPGNPSSSSSPGPLAVKRTPSEDPACTTLTKKAKNTITSVGS